MIFFFAGPSRSGSHFQKYIVTDALRQAGRPFEEVVAMDLHDHELTRSRRLLGKLSDRPEQLISVLKGHWGAPEERDALLACPELRVFLIWRDLGDTLVSWFRYRQRRYGRSYRDFEDFYRREGRFFLIQSQLRYRRTWQAVLPHPRVHLSSYEALRGGFAAEAAPLLAFAGVKGVDLEALEAGLAIERMRERRGDREGRFFRKGEVGERQAVIPAAISDEIDALARLDDRALMSEALRRHPRRSLSHYRSPVSGLLSAASDLRRRLRRR